MEGQMTSAETEFFEAIRSGDLGRVQALIAAAPALISAKNDSGASGLLTAIYTGRHEIRDLLLAGSAPLELHEAAAAGQLDRVKEIVDANPALAKSYSPDGFPAMALAAFLGHFDVARYLVKNGADVNAISTNGTGYNALTAAVTSGHTEIVKWLLESGADANHKYGPGYTPLIAAAANGGLDIVKLLLASGADRAAQTSDGKTALSIAEERKAQAVAEYLKNC